MDDSQQEAKKRVSYTLHTKRKAVEKVKEIGIRGASRELNIPRKNLQRWCKQTDLLEEAALNKDLSVRTKRRFKGNTPKFPLLEEALMDFIKEEREKRNVVTGKMIRRKALVLGQNLYLANHGFKASHGWFERMAKRNKLSFRRVTSVGQKIPPDAPEHCDLFLDDMMKSYGNFEIIMNMDETPCYFDMPSSSTFDLRGVNTVKVKTTGNEKLRFTCVLTAVVTTDYFQKRTEGKISEGHVD